MRRTSRRLPETPVPESERCGERSRLESIIGAGRGHCDAAGAISATYAASESARTVSVAGTGGCEPNGYSFRCAGAAGIDASR